MVMILFQVKDEPASLFFFFFNLVWKSYPKHENN